MNEESKKDSTGLMKIWYRNSKSVLIFSTLLIFYCTIASKANSSLLQYKPFTETGLYIYDILQGSLLSYWIFALFVYYSYCISKGVIKTTIIDYALYSIEVSIFILCILWVGNPWNYNKCFAVDLKIWWSIFCVTVIGVSLYRGWLLYKEEFEKCHNASDSSRNKGFSADYPLDSQVDKISDLTFFTRKEIANEITERLYQTDVSKEPFAVCISGSWGAGKTSFINYIREKVEKDKGRKKLIEFEPWNCQTPAQINVDFFTLLSQHLYPQAPQALKIIKDYIVLLISLNPQNNDVSKKLIDIIDGHLEKHISTCKQELYRCLSNIKDQLYIFIDDLDRLEFPEILEVLRIIRNTAKFPNLIFIVSIDKQYTTQLFRKAGFDDGGNYLEKIFQVEIPMPRIDNIDMLDELRHEFRMNIQNLTNKQIESLIVGISNTEEKRKLLNDVLVNFRIAKRLIRQFSVSANYLQNTLHEKEFEYSDLFYLEMLRYIDYTLYNKLSLSPRDYLEIGINNISGRYFILKDNVDIEKTTNSYRILKFLFSDERRVRLGRLSILANYYNYFCMSQPRNSIKIADFQNLINNDNGDRFNIIKCAIKDWSRSNRRTETTTDSIYHCFISSFDSAKKYTFAEIKPYLLFCLYWASYDITYQISQVDALSIMLSKNIVKSEDDGDLILSYIKQELEKLLKQKDLDLIHFVWVMSKLHRFDTVYTKQIIDNEYIDKFIRDDCFNTLCERQYQSKDINAQELVQKSRPICRFAMSACGKDNDDKAYSLVIDRIIEYFSSLPQKSKYYYRVIDAFPSVLESEPNKAEVEQLSKIFGGYDTITKYKLYLDNCFDKENASRTGSLHCNKTQSLGIKPANFY